jgi:hypothetical protein
MLNPAMTTVAMIARTFSSWSDRIANVSVGRYELTDCRGDAHGAACGSHDSTCRSIAERTGLDIAWPPGLQPWRREPSCPVHRVGHPHDVRGVVAATTGAAQIQDPGVSCCNGAEIAAATHRLDQD